MASPRFYCPESLHPNQTIRLPESLAHHVRVLRLAAGCTVTLFDGQGGEIEGILDFQGKNPTVTLGEHRPHETELGGRITLVQGLPAGDKMDWVIEKAVELGVAKILPVAAQRSVLQLSGPRLEKRLLHWQRLIQAASEQCGRNRLLEIEAPASLEQVLGKTNQANRFLCDPSGSVSLREALLGPKGSAQHIKELTLLVGPEGGWSPQEFATATRMSAQSIQFGRRILRSETAGLALVSAACALLNW
jgi:16S rRNA (uracil1498-N3)-methyltransferase